LNFSLYIAKRYLRSASKNNAINIINGIASIGIVVGAMALFVVLSVFSGLRDFSLSFSNDFDPDIKLFPKTGKTFLISPEQITQTNQLKDIASYSKIAEDRVLFMFDSKEIVSTLKGVESNYLKTIPIQKSLFQGEFLEPNTTQVVIGYGISQKLSLGLFDYNNPFEVYVPKPGKGTIENPEDAFRKSNLSPVAIYAVSEDLDSKYVFADIGLAQELLGYKTNQISGIEVKLKSSETESKTVAELQKIFGNKVDIKTRAQLNESLYKMLNTENIAVYLIFTLVIIIALFNLVGALIMMILDKKENLKTLLDLGVQVSDLRKIFLFQGTLLSVFGGLFGLLLGVIIVLLQQYFQFVMITPTLAYPVVFSYQNILIVFFTIISLGLLASLIASSRVSKKLFS
jgi:lipoprotein-releasing system permease protein